MQVKESYGNKNMVIFGFHPTCWSVHPAYNEHYRQDAAKLLLFSDIGIPYIGIDMSALVNWWLGSAGAFKSTILSPYYFCRLIFSLKLD